MFREAIASGPATPMTREDWDSIEREAMEKLAGEAIRAQPLQKKALTEDEFMQHLLEIGLVSQLPIAPDHDADEEEDAPITITGEPLSETVLRERR